MSTSTSNADLAQAGAVDVLIPLIERQRPSALSSPRVRWASSLSPCPSN